MKYSDCYHEICHLWYMINKLGFKYGRAFVAFDDGVTGMLSIDGYKFTYNNMEDLENATKFIIAGIVGDTLTEEISNKNIFESFTKIYTYNRDASYFRKYYNTAAERHKLNKTQEDWFYELFEDVDNFFKQTDLKKIEEAAKTLMENKEYSITID